MSSHQQVTMMILAIACVLLVFSSITARLVALSDENEQIVKRAAARKSDTCRRASVQMAVDYSALAIAEVNQPTQADAQNFLRTDYNVRVKNEDFLIVENGHKQAGVIFAHASGYAGRMEERPVLMITYSEDGWPRAQTIAEDVTAADAGRIVQEVLR